MWKHFKKIELSCSIDHYGERAEWLRHGTDWGLVESNLLKFRELDYISFQLNTVFSLFNYLTIGEFYSYLKSKGLVRTHDWYHSLYLAVHPSHYSAKSLPKELKIDATNKAMAWANQYRDDETSLSRLVTDAVNFAKDSDTWAANKETFMMHTGSGDKIRGENFWKTFPELNKLQDLTE
jgi:hypothetical protein